MSVEQLWDLPVISENPTILSLDVIATDLQDRYDKSGKKSFFGKKSKKDSELKLMLDIVLEIGTTLTEEAEALSDANEIKKHNQKILAKIADKQDLELDEKSVEELKKMLK